MARRLAIISSNYYPRTCGVGDHSMRLGQALLRHGVDARIFTRAPAELHPEAPELPVTPVMGTSAAMSALAIARCIREWRASDVVLQYVPTMLGASRFGSLAAPLLTRRLRGAQIRVVAICHELYLPWAVRPDLALAAALNRIEFAWLLASANRVAITTVPRHRALSPLARLVRAADRLALLPVGSNVLPIAARPVPGRFDIGLFSTLARGKRFDVVLEAFERLAAEIPAVHLVLLGDLGDPESPRFRDLTRRIQRSPVVERIRLTGKLPLANVAEAVSCLDAYLFPMDVGATTRSGTLPLPLGAGVPVVALRGRDTGALFVGDENIVFAHELSGTGFAQAVMRLRTEPHLAERVAQGGRRLYRDHLDWPVLAGRALELLGSA